MLTPEGRGACVYTPATLCTELIMIHGTELLFSLCAGKNESIAEKLRSIISQLEFRFVLEQWEEKGVQFRTYLYVPEVHPGTNEVFCEREDEAHVLKVHCDYTCTCAYTWLHCLKLVLENFLCCIVL